MVGLAFIETAIAVGSKPFSISPNNVNPAAFLLPIRSTLVAPGFFDPVLRGSGRLISLQVIMAADTEPSR